MLLLHLTEKESRSNQAQPPNVTLLLTKMNICSGWDDWTHRCRWQVTWPPCGPIHWWLPLGLMYRTSLQLSLHSNQHVCLLKPSTPARMIGLFLDQWCLRAAGQGAPSAARRSKRVKHLHHLWAVLRDQSFSVKALTRWKLWPLTVQKKLLKPKNTNWTEFHIASSDSTRGSSSIWWTSGCSVKQTASNQKQVKTNT